VERTVSDEPSGDTLRSLMSRFPRAGRLEWIGLRRWRGAVIPAEKAEAIAGRGLAGDHRVERGNAGGGRQVTLIQHEHLAALAAMTGHGRVDPAWLRRNLVVSGLNLLALKDREFRIGDALLRHSGLCHPCSRMEQVLGPGGYNAMRGHGGITAEVVQGAVIRVGDAVRGT
jgi:MOSC domain-containing protein YiiM